MTNPPHLRLRITEPDDVVAAVPYLLGFHPRDSLVSIVAERDDIRMVARMDLPGDTDPGANATTAAVMAQHGSAAILVGFGTPDRVDPAAAALRTALSGAGVDVVRVLRVTDGRYWTLTPAGAQPPGGIPFDAAATAVAAEATLQGVAPLANREAVERLIEPVTGEHQAAMQAATDAALQRLTTMIETAAPGRPPARWHVEGTPPALMDTGIAAVTAAYAAAGRGDTLNDADTAWLTAVLLIPDVRDHAWTIIDGSDAHRRLWIDVTRRATPATVPAPACLLAITAYLAADAVLARIAVDRVRLLDPDYTLAQLIDQALLLGIPPQQWRDATGH